MHKEHPSMDEFTELSEHVDSIYKEHEQLDEMVFNHEDLIATIISSLLNEENLSSDTRASIQEAYNQLYGKKEVKNG